MNMEGALPLLESQEESGKAFGFCLLSVLLLYSWSLVRAALVV